MSSGDARVGGAAAGGGRGGQGQGAGKGGGGVVGTWFKLKLNSTFWLG